MPIYEYTCTNCGHRCEQLEKISAERIQVCPKCQETTLARNVSNTYFKLKGSGWYETDFKDKKTKQEKTDTNKESTSEANNQNKSSPQSTSTGTNNGPTKKKKD